MSKLPSSHRAPQLWRRSPLGRTMLLKLHEKLGPRAAVMAIVAQAGQMESYPAPHLAVVGGLPIADETHDIERALFAWAWSALAQGYTQSDLAHALLLLPMCDGLHFLGELLAGKLPNPSRWQVSCQRCRAPATLATQRLHSAGSLLWQCQRCSKQRRDR